MWSSETLPGGAGSARSAAASACGILRSEPSAKAAARAAPDRAGTSGRAPDTSRSASQAAASFMPLVLGEAPRELLRGFLGLEPLEARPPPPG